MIFYVRPQNARQPVPGHRPTAAQWSITTGAAPCLTTVPWQFILSSATSWPRTDHGWQLKLGKVGIACEVVWLWITVSLSLAFLSQEASSNYHDIFLQIGRGLNFYHRQKLRYPQEISLPTIVRRGHSRISWKRTSIRPWTNPNYNTVVTPELAQWWVENNERADEANFQVEFHANLRRLRPISN